MRGQVASRSGHQGESSAAAGARLWRSSLYRTFPLLASSIHLLEWCLAVCTAATSAWRSVGMIWPSCSPVFGARRRHFSLSCDSGALGRAYVALCPRCHQSEDDKLDDKPVTVRVSTLGAWRRRRATGVRGSEARTDSVLSIGADGARALVGGPGVSGTLTESSLINNGFGEDVMKARGAGQEPESSGLRAMMHQNRAGM